MKLNLPSPGTAYSRFPMVISCLGSIALSVLPLISLHASSADRAYDHSSDPDTYYKDWMSWVGNNTLLSEMSLPGTHDAVSLYGGDLTQTQSFSIEEQLKAGIRVFDIRFRHLDDRFPLYHGSVFQKTYFEDVLADCNDFLDDHKSETIILRISHKGSPDEKPGDNTRTDRETFLWYRDQTTNGARIWKPTTGDPRPTLGEVRNQIVISTVWNESACTNCGIRENYFNYGLNYEADWDLATLFEMNAKWDDIKSHLDDIRVGAPDVFYTSSLCAAAEK